MGLSLIPQNTRGLWEERQLRLLILLSLFLQLTHATQGSRRKFIFRNWIQAVVWTIYLTDSISTLTLSVLLNNLANINETTGMIDPRSQIRAFWAPLLLLHLGGTDAVTAYALVDNKLWKRQLPQLVIQVGLVCYIHSMALLGTPTLSILAAGVILVGFIKCAERTLCLYWASKGPLRDSMILCPDADPVLPRMELFAQKYDEAYWVKVDEITQTPAPEHLSVNSGQACKKDMTLVKAYELFKIFKRLFVGLAVHSVDLDVSQRVFMDPYMRSVEAFEIVEIELGFMYDLLYTKAPLLNCAWGIIRWVISLSVLCAVLVFFSLHDNKDNVKVDICITLLLISAAILLEIYSLLLAISSDWIHHRWPQRLRRSPISSAIHRLRFSPNPRWSNSVAQFSLLSSSVRKRKSIFRIPRSAKLHELMIDRKVKELIFDRMKEMVSLGGNIGLKSRFASFKGDMRKLLMRSNCDRLIWSWSAEMEFHQSVLIWHIATELCHYKDRGSMEGEDINSKMSMLVSRYMLYLLVFHPSMLPTEIGVVRYEHALVEAQEFFDAELAMFSKDEGSSISSVVIKWAHKLCKKEAHVHTRFNSCKKLHKSRESRDLCELCWLLLQVGTDLPLWTMRVAKTTSVLFSACHLVDQLKSVDMWDTISKVWVRMLVYAACQSKDYKHCESLSRGGELLSHVWLLMAHLGIVMPE